MICRRAHLRKMSLKWGDWGYATFCDRTMRAQYVTSSESKVTCKDCLRLSIMKLELKIEDLKGQLDKVCAWSRGKNQ